MGWQMFSSANTDGTDGTVSQSLISSVPINGTPTGSWIGTLAIDPGTYDFAVSTTDKNPTGGLPGPSSTAKVSFTVVANPFPAPPSSAAVFANLNASPKSWTADTANSGGASGVGTVEAGIGVPTISGATLEQSSNGSWTNTLAYTKPSCPKNDCTSFGGYFMDDLWYYIPDTTRNLQALEFDPDMYHDFYWYFMSMQCRVSDGLWYFWNMSTFNWVNTDANGNAIKTYSCNTALQTDMWHHFQLYGRHDISTHMTTYITFVVDGQVIFQDLNNSYPAWYDSSEGSTSWEGLVAEHQIDNNAAAGTRTVYYDMETMTVW